MRKQASRLNGGKEPKTTETAGMAAVGEMSAKDREFEALLRRAADFQNADRSCKLRGEAS